MKGISVILILGTAVFHVSCKPSVNYDKQVKGLDSLKIVVQESLSNFNTLDSSKFYDAYKVQFTYSNFIMNNLKDTVSKESAEHLQNFYVIGKNMVNYLSSKTKWTNEANLSIKQLSDLSYDLKNNNIEPHETNEFINEETKEAYKIIEELKTKTLWLNSSMEKYNSALPTVKETILKINNNVLPEIVTPQIKPQIEVD